MWKRKGTCDRPFCGTQLTSWYFQDNFPYLGVTVSVLRVPEQEQRKDSTLLWDMGEHLTSDEYTYSKNGIVHWILNQCKEQFVFLIVFVSVGLVKNTF